MSARIIDCRHDGLTAPTRNIVSVATILRFGGGHERSGMARVPRRGECHGLGGVARRGDGGVPRPVAGRRGPAGRGGCARPRAQWGRGADDDRRPPAPPPAATLRQVADHIDEIIGAGTHTQRKALIEALVADVRITGPGRVVPVFRIPQATGAERADSSGEVSGVRAMTNLVRPVVSVGPVGFEPTLAGS